jgi:hypothetical protein
MIVFVEVIVVEAVKTVATGRVVLEATSITVASTY